MQKMYWAWLTVTAEWLSPVYHPDDHIVMVLDMVKNKLHEELKYWRNVASTSRLNHTERYHYITYVHAMMVECHKIYFDSESYKYEQVKFTYIN